MAAMREEYIEADRRNVEDTIPLTEAAERESISPNEYARRRAFIVGEGNILEYIVIPLVQGMWRHWFPLHNRNQVMVKPKPD